MPGNSSKWKGIGVALAVFVSAFLLPVVGYAQKRVQDKTFVVIGSSRVYSENIQAARDAAISESLVTAVALMTEEVLEVDSLVENFARVNTIIYENTDAFVQEYKVLTETESGKFYRVIVKATVAGKKIAKQLSAAGILRAKIDLPSVLFFISEQNLQDDSPRYWWGKQMGGFESISEATMADILEANGFPVVEHRGVEIPKMADLGSDLKPELSEDEAINLGARLQATAESGPLIYAGQGELADFNGLDMNLGNLYRLSDAQTRSISPENFTGEKGKGGIEMSARAAAGNNYSSGHGRLLWSRHGCHVYAGNPGPLSGTDQIGLQLRHHNRRAFSDYIKRYSAAVPARTKACFH